MKKLKSVTLPLVISCIFASFSGFAVIPTKLPPPVVAEIPTKLPPPAIAAIPTKLPPPVTFVIPTKLPPPANTKIVLVA